MKQGLLKSTSLQHLTARRRAAGYTLIEMMIVITIIGVLIGLAVVNFSGAGDDARITSTRQEIRTLETALDMFRMHNGRYPSNEQGLQALVEKPADVVKWQEGGYLRERVVPVDPWGRPYRYANPGRRGAIDVYSLGEDGRESDDDVWAKE